MYILGEALLIFFGLVGGAIVIAYYGHFWSGAVGKTTWTNKFMYEGCQYNLQDYPKLSLKQLAQQNTTLWFYPRDHWFRVIIAQELPPEVQSNTREVQEIYQGQTRTLSFKQEDEIIGYISRWVYWQIRSHLFQYKMVNGLKGFVKIIPAERLLEITKK